MTAGSPLLRVIEETLRCDYSLGAVTPVGVGYATGWRTLPMLVTAQLLDGRSRIEFADRPSVELNHGEALCIPGGVHHRITIIESRGAVSRWSHIAFQVLTAMDVIALIAPPLVIRGQAAERIGDLNTALATLMERPDHGLRELIRKKELGFALLSVIAGCASEQGAALDSLRQAERLAPVLEYIDAHFPSGRMSLARLARLVGLSPSRFHAVFKDALGVSPLNYVQARRMRSAQQFLISSDLPINEVAEASGYPDPFHFSRLFKKLNGISPLAYRQQAVGIRL